MEETIFSRPKDFSWKLCNPRRKWSVDEQNKHYLAPEFRLLIILKNFELATFSISSELRGFRSQNAVFSAGLLYKLLWYRLLINF